jgi:membrane dipeptidase
MKAPQIREEVRAFHDSQIVIDLHVDVIIQQRLFRYDISKQHRPWMRRQPFFRHADIPRMLEGGYTFAALGIHYWPWESKRGWKEVRKQLAYLEKVTARDERVVLARTAADVEAAHADGKLALAPGLEGSHLINGDLEHLDEAAERGVVYLTLAHFSKNQVATPGMGRGKNQADGLTELGREVVARLNELKLVVDVAHVNWPGAIEACEVSTQPVVATHTCAVGLQMNNRGVTDDAIRAIAETGGVMGIIFCPSFLRGKLNASLDAVVDHTFYIADLVGPEHLAVGSDFDGWIPTIPNDIRDCRDLALLTQKLLDRGMSKDEVAGLLGLNFLRVFRTIRGA